MQQLWIQGRLAVREFPAQSCKICLLGLLAVLIAGCGAPEDGARPKRGAQPVVVMKAASMGIATRVEALGTARSNESIDITSNATDIIRQIRFADGQQVRKGDIIVLLDQGQEQAQLSAARARLAEHRREEQRLETLLQKKAAARREYDERLTLIEVTRSEIEELEALRSDRTLRAPFDGVLGIRRMSPGQLVQPGQVITTLDDIDPVKLDFSVPAIHLPELAVGTPIIATADARPGERFSGHVDVIDSRIDSTTRSILLRAIISNSDGLIKPGMLMHVTLLERQRQAVVVPEECIVQRKEDHFITVVEKDNRASERKVSIGERQPGIVEITAGVEVGEMIVVRGMRFVRTGDKVTIQEVRESIPGQPAATAGER